MSFLQGLITNNIQLLETQKSLYSCLLTPNGKFLFDFFVFRCDHKIYIECEGGERAENLLNRLQMFKLRADVSFDLDKNISVYAVFDAENQSGTFQDTRHSTLGFRCLNIPDHVTRSDFNIWDEIRLRLGVPDGSRDMIPQKSTLLECNIDRFNGVDFNKGCYMGQELTARMHFRGLTKKTLCPVQFNGKIPDAFTDIVNNEGKLVAEMRSSCGDIGLVLIKKDLLNNSAALPFKVL